MRVLFLADAVFDDLPGGSRVVARELSHELSQRGHEVTFLVAHQKQETPDDERLSSGIRVVRYSGAGQGPAFVKEGQRACARLLQESTFDVVHTHFAYASVGPLRVVPASIARVRSFYGPWHAEGLVEDRAKLSGQPLKRLIGEIKNRLRYAVREKVESDNLRESDRTVVLSEQSWNEVRDLAYPDSRVTLIPGGVDVVRFCPSPLDKAAIRQRLGLPEDKTLLFSVRRLAPRMGLDNLIAAMPEILQAVPNAFLVIGGKGPHKEALEKAVTERNLQESVRLVGFIPDEDLADYYRSADLFVLPTVALEGFGLVTAEALACGTPVVGTPVGATPEILSEIDKGLIAEGVEPPALAKAIVTFLKREDKRAFAPDTLHQYVNQKYTWERHANAIEAVYEQARTDAAKRSSLTRPLQGVVR